MLIYEGGNDIIIRRRDGDISHVRLGVTRIEFWVAGCEMVRRTKELTKPHVEHDINELRDLLQELEDLKRLHNVTN